MAMSATRSTVKLAFMGLVFSVVTWVGMTDTAFAQPSDDINKGSRAQFMLGILRFVQWEDNQDQKNINLCILGKPLSAGELLSMDGQVLWDDIRLHVERRSAADIADCDVAVTGRLKSRYFRVMAARAEKNSILTICDKCSRKYMPIVMVHVVDYEDKIGFRANVAEVRRAGLRLDASLLELASEVKL